MSDSKQIAVDLLRKAAADGLIEATEPRHQPEMVERIAAALRAYAAEELRAAVQDVYRVAARYTFRANELDPDDSDGIEVDEAERDWP